MAGSLLLIAVVWIVLLAPLLLRNQSPVRRTAKALTETRVLHKGGESLQRKKRLTPAVESFQSADIDEELELVEAEPEFFLIDDADDSRPLTLKDRAAKSGRKKSTDAVESVASESTAEAEIVDAEVVDAAEAETATDETADTQLDAIAETIDGEVVETADATPSEVAAGAEAEEPAPAVAHASPVNRAESYDDTDTGSFRPVRLVEDSADNSAEAEEAVTARPQVVEISTAYFRGSDLDPQVKVEEDEVSVEKGEKEAAAHATAVAEQIREEQEQGSVELDEEDMRYLASRKGRGVYDPVASQQAAMRRLRRRKQVLLALLVLCVLTGIAGVIWGGLSWIATVVAVGFTVFYLYSLRRSAIEEAKTRRRRIARMRRARLGVRNTEDGELGVPDRLRRPGAVIVEADDSDPDFEHLDYLDAADYFGDFEDLVEHDSRQRIYAV
ncbi:gephyrin-like molybdotransferase receptor GlpR [uncultured Corynebacterium sp.]|uniref:divisome protein SepX/GlpR n=1 Tax=uncultured Corynebacterium sp. TaxID=159447 RepID=UPI00259A7228|nr:gephyrin-like molybdotransferase receptor GlpR [uncultured Corynebacterium sp.]